MNRRWREMPNGIDLSAQSPDFSTTPEDRIRANLTCEIRRHLPKDRTLLYGKLARDLAADLVKIASTYDLDYYRKKMT